MADERLRTKLVAAGYKEELVWSWDREELIARYAEVLYEGAIPKVAPAPVDPARESERLAFEMKRWEAELAERKLQKEEETRKWDAEQEERNQIKSNLKNFYSAPYKNGRERLTKYTGLIIKCEVKYNIGPNRNLILKR